MGVRNFDLLGDPIPEGRGEPGRTGHIATAENVSKVRVLVLAGLSKVRVAAELGITVPTLNKHYFASGKISLRHAQAMALAEARGRNMLQLEKQAAAGNVSAIKEVGKRLDRIAVDLKVATVTAPVRQRQRPLGKKEADMAAAMRAEDEMGLLFGGTRPN